MDVSSRGSANVDATSSRAQGGKWSRLGSLTVLVSAAALPTFPALAIAAAAAYSIYLLNWRPTYLETPLGVRYVWILAILACAAQTLSHTLLAPVRPLTATIDAPFRVDATVAGNLISNTDLAGIQGWNSGSGFGDYSAAIEPGVWRLSVVDGEEKFTEARSRQEVRILGGVPYGARALVRHDGTEFSGRLVFRTREGWRPATTETHELASGLVLLEGSLPAQESATRLRTFHIADLEGDWSYIDIALASLHEGRVEAKEAFVPHSSLVTWLRGMWWWIGSALMLTTIGLAARSLQKFGQQDMLMLGLLCGLTVQLLIVVGQLFGNLVGRPTGSLGDPNLLAHAAVVTGLSCVAIASRPVRTAGAVAAIVIPIVVLSQSDAAIVGLAVGGILVAVALMKRRRLLILTVSAGAIVLGALIGGPEALEALMSDTNNVARLQAWESVAIFAAESPFAGIGTGNFAHHYEFAAPNDQGPRYRNVHAHTLLGVAAESGLPTALALIGGLLFLVVGYFRANLPLLGTVLCVVILLNLVDLTLFNPAIILPWWMVHASRATDGITPTNP